MKLMLCAAGRLKSSPFEDLFHIYRKRILFPLQIHEVDVKGHLAKDERQRRETQALLEKIPAQAEIIAWDERGVNLSSAAFAAHLKSAQDQSKTLAFIIGGADGLSQEGRDKAHKIFSFGAATWPHLLVRVMLLEQLYRAQQILAGHPYHRV